MVRTIQQSLRVVRLLLIILSVLSIGVLVGAQDVMQVVQNMPGIKPEMSYKDFGNGELVNLANGGLTVTHPSSVSLPQNMGGVLRPVRVHNDKNITTAWGYTSDETDLPYGFLGYGWTLSYGRIYVTPVKHAKYGSNPIAYETRAYYFFQDETGAVHRLYRNSTVENLNLNNPFPQSTEWYFSSDGSYIRAKYTYASTGGTWVIYFPDGSTRAAGGTTGSSYIAATLGPIQQNSDGTRYIDHLTNPHVCGWYVTQILDRTSNAVNISYRTYSPPTQPFGGSIQTITDQFSTRSISFSVNSSTGFLTGISGGGMSESYTIGTDASTYFVHHGAMTQLPTLLSVSDAASVQTVYKYSQDSGADDSHLTAIYYPTGAVSQYVYHEYTYTFCQWPKNPNYADCGSADGDEIVKHILNLRATGSSAWKALTWTYHRYDPGYFLGRASQTQPVRITDPLGGFSVHFFSYTDSPNSAEISPGREVVVLRYAPGTICSYDPSRTDTNRIFSTHKYWDWGDRVSGGSYYGDLQRCQDDGVTGPQTLNQGNLRVWKISEKEYPSYGGSYETWSRDTWQSGWDGFGHYRVSQTTGTGYTGTWTTASDYDLKKDLSTTLYQLDRVTLNYAGTSTSNGLVAMLLPNGERETEPTGLSTYGEFKVVKNTYETANRGLLLKKIDFAAKSVGFYFDYSTLALTAAPSVGASDRTTEITSYTSQGNIAQIKYYLGPSTSPTSVYYANFSWSYGMVSQMWWDSSLHYYELTRNILSTNSRIDYQDDPNNFRTQFTYDSAGRVTKIEHKNSLGGMVEYPEQAAYVNDSTTFGTTTWATFHQMKVYKGSQTTSIPSVSPGTGQVTTLPLATDTLAWYTFDDLGRLVTTQNVMRAADANGNNPGAYWSQRETRYDALGRTVFTSEPFFIYEGLSTSSYNQTMQLWDETSCTLVYPSPTYPVYVPMKSGVPFGTWDTINSGTSRTSPFGTIASLEPFCRTLRVIKPDGTYVDKSYSGLSETTTAYVMGSASATTYTKNILGWLLSVSPPAGAAASYSYDGLGKLSTVSLNSGGQARSFTYDALGHMTASTQPELGSWSFVYNSIGNVSSYTDGQSQVFSNGYDWKGRLTSTTQAGIALIANTYDGSGGVPTIPSKGKLVRSVGTQKDVDNNQRTTTLDFTYLAANGWLGTVAQTVSTYGMALSYTLGYDSMGQVTTQALPSSNTITNTYTAGFLASRGLSTPAQVSSLIYNPAGALKQLVFNNTMKELGDFDVMSRPKGYQFERNGTVIWTNGSYASANYPYQYDGSGNITSIGNMTSPSTPDTFAYDLLSRLTGATVRKSASTPAHAFAYQYDVYGNLVGRAESAQGFANLYTYLTTPVLSGGCGVDASSATDYVKNLCFTSTVRSETNGVSNKLDQVTRGGTLTVNGINYTTGITQSSTTTGYSGGNGNVTDDGTYLYAYDPMNRQVAVRLKSNNQLQAQYFYDAAGERSAVIKYTGGTASNYTQYLRNGTDVVFEKTWTLPGPTASSEKTYLGVQGKMAVTKQVVGTTTTYTYYGTDHLGTVRATATFDAWGAYQSSTLHDYEPYGLEIPLRDGTSANTHKYTGHERDVLDSNAGTFYSNDYMHFRGFALGVGRFLRPDNLSGSALYPQSWNLCSYVCGGPASLLDPTGHAASGGYVGTETAPPGAFPDGGQMGSLIAGFFREGIGTIGSAIPWTIWVHLNIIVDKALDLRTATSEIKTQVEYANSYMRFTGIQYVVDRIVQGTLYVVLADPMRPQDLKMRWAGDTQLLSAKCMNIYVSNDSGPGAGYPGLNAGEMAILNMDRIKKNTLAHEALHVLGNRGIPLFPNFSDPTGALWAGWDLWNDNAVRYIPFVGPTFDLWWLRLHARNFPGDAK